MSDKENLTVVVNHTLGCRVLTQHHPDADHIALWCICVCHDDEAKRLAEEAERRPRGGER